MRPVVALLACVAVACGDAERRPALDLQVDDAAHVAHPTCGAAAALLYDDAVWGAGSELRAAKLRADDAGRTLAQLPDGTLITGVAAAPSPAHGDVELVVSAIGGDGCALLGLDAGGGERWRVVEPSDQACRGPALSGRLALWPVGEALIEVALDSGATPRRLALGQPTTTGVVAVEARAGGGTHWLVGAGEQAVSVAWDAATLDVRERLDAGGEVTALTPLGQALVALRVRIAPEAGPGRLLAVITTAEGLAFVGQAHEAPGDILTHPVSLSCDEVAGGGTHWWCPAGLLVAGGDGWLRAWSPVAWDVQWGSDEPLTWTGLAVTGDGQVAGGGTHWLPDPEWEVRSVGPDADEQLFSGEGAGCVASPVIDSDGWVAAPPFFDAQVVARAATDLIGLARGWTRPSGGNQATGKASVGRCDDDHERGFIHYDHAGSEVYSYLPDGDTTVVAGVTVPGGAGVARPWLAWADTDGKLRDAVIPGPAGAVGRGIPAIVGLERADRGVGVGWVEAGDGGLVDAWVAGYARGVQAPLWRFRVAQAAEVRLVGLSTDSASGDEVQVVAMLEVDGGVRLVRVDPVAGVVADVPYLGPAFTAQSFGRGHAGQHVVSGAAAVALVRFFGADLEEITTFAIEGMAVSEVVGVGVDASGSYHVLAHEVRLDGERQASLYRMQAGGPATKVDLGRVKAASIGTQLDGTDLIITGERTAFAVTASGIGLPHLLPELQALTFPRGIAPSGLDGFPILTMENAPSGETVRFTRIDLDRHGFATCAEAGRCVWAHPGECAASDACHRSGCEPASGACVEAALDSAACP